MYYIIFILFILLYAVLPYILSFAFGIKVFRKNKHTTKITFTFDDGPDSKYTPILLDLLKKYEVKATFFVVGSKAEKLPELIQRMHNEGHLIGIHNYVHHANWLMTPWKVRKGLNRSAEIIENIIGVRPSYYRPPWGLLNIFDLILRSKYKMILWSVMVGDWRTSVGSDEVKNRLLTKIKGGDVIVLHDNGDTFGANADAPMNMINALTMVLQQLNSKEIKCVRLDELVSIQQND